MKYTDYLVDAFEVLVFLCVAVVFFTLSSLKGIYDYVRDRHP